MQLWFLLYHVVGAEAAFPYIRWTVSAYVFLTGYGNTVYYLKGGAATAPRVLGMLLRMGLFSVMLCGATGTPWFEYYIPFLHMVHYGITSVACLGAMRLLRTAPGTKNGTAESSVLCGIVGVCGALLPALLLQSQAGSSAVLWLLRGVFGEAGGKYLLLRLQLDRFSGVVGMLAALLQLQANAHTGASSWKQLSLRGFAHALLTRYHVLRWACEAAALAVALCVARSFPERAQYKLVNAYVGTLWIPAYLECRLVLLPWALAWWRGDKGAHTAEVPPLPLLVWLGRHSLECYLLQFHLLMTRSASAILVLLPEHAAVSFLLQSTVYAACARAAFVATDVLRAALRKEPHAVLALLALVVASMGLSVAL